MTTFLFAHGAGAGQAHPWMRAWAERLGTLGEVHTFDYPYITQGRRLPPRLPTLEPVHLAQLEQLVSSTRQRVVLVGKSMGARLSCRVAAPHLARGVVCLGYPLVGKSKKNPLRDAELRELDLPCLLVQGQRDPMSPATVLDEVVQSLSPRPQVHVVPDGDHSLLARKRQLAAMGRSQEDLDSESLDCIAAFVESLPA